MSRKWAKAGRGCNHGRGRRPCPRACSTGGAVEGRSKNGEPRSRDRGQSRHSGQFLRVHQIQRPHASKSN